MTSYMTPYTATSWPAAQAACTTGLVHTLNTWRLTLSSHRLRGRGSRAAAAVRGRAGEGQWQQGERAGGVELPLPK